ncbi:MAG: PAS domain S-box protein [Thermoplasmata archaeon]
MDKKGFDESIRKLKELLEKIIKNAPSMIIGINLQGNIMIFNNEAERITGYSYEEAMGKSFLPLLIAEEYRDVTTKIFYKVNQDKPSYNIETKIITKNGDERLISWCTGPVKNIENKIIGGIYFGSDISPKEVLQANGESTALAREDNRVSTTISDPIDHAVDTTNPPEEKTPAEMEWENVFNSISELITVISKDNRILRVNAALAGKLNTEPEELIGKKCCEVFHDTDSPIHGCIHKKIFETGKIFSEEIHDESSGVTTLISCSPFYDSKEELIGSILIARDITGKKRTEEEPSVSKKLRNVESFVSAIEHEMDNPLGGVLSYAEAIMDEEDPLKIRLYSKEIIDSATRIIQILCSLARSSRSPSGYVMEPIDLNDIIKTSLNIMSHNEKFEKVKIAIDLNPIPKIEGNQDELQQAIIYLITNSLEVMDGNGKIHISTRKSNGNVQVIFKDEGLEIPNEQLSWMFDPSSTLEGEGMRKGYEKTEMGLRMYAISKILKKHNAPILVESEVGKGRTFIINFPHMEAGKDSV